MTPTCWVLTDGRTGTDNNSLGLAERLGYGYTVKKVSLSGFSKLFAPWIMCRAESDLRSDPPLGEPWPDLVISAGRTPAVAALFIKKKSGGKTKIVHITSPGVSPRRFDLVVAPLHDRLSGPQVRSITGALHRVTADKLSEAKTRFTPQWAHYPRPWVGLLVGGSTKGLSLRPEDVDSALCALRRNYPAATLLATASRRTSPLAHETLKMGVDYLWDGTGENPYLGLLACADVLAVTSESVSMVSEACSTGKPVMLIRLSGKNDKLARFQRAVVDGGYAHWLDTKQHKPTPRVLDDAAAVVELVRAWF